MLLHYVCKCLLAKKYHCICTVPLAIIISFMKVYTVYGKTFEGENFRGFRGFVANRESFPLESFAVYSA